MLTLNLARQQRKSVDLLGFSLDRARPVHLLDHLWARP